MHWPGWLLNPPGLALRAGADAASGLAFLSIALTLILWMRARPDIRYRGVLYLFVMLVVTSGLTHLMAVLGLFWPVFALESLVRLAAAAACVATATLLWPVLPRLIALPPARELARLNRDLTAIVEEQRRTATLLRESEARVWTANLDLTRRVEEKTAALKSANDRLTGIVDSAMDGLITIDEQQRIVLVNPAAAAMFGVEADRLLGAPLDGLIPTRFRLGHSRQVRAFRDAGAAARRMGAPRSVSGLRANGEEFPLEASISQVVVDGQRLATVIMRDITERQANETARRLLAQEVDHRAKNALAIVQAVVSLTQAPTKEAYVASVRGRIAALSRAHSLLAENRWRGGDLPRIIADEIEPFEKADQVAILGPSIILDPDAVQPVALIIHELATNAVKYGALSTEAGGVEVTVALTPERSLRLTWTETGGPAVEAPRSAGFGTTLITQIASRQLHGRVEIDWPPEGLKVVATLPPSTHGHARLAEPARVEADAPPRFGDMAGLRLLVLEDELLIALELCEGLKDLGCEIVGPAATVGEAQSLIAAAERLDAAILDINIGGEMAFPVAEALRDRGVPFVFCTGYEQPRDIEAFEAYPIVRKPVDLRHLCEHIGRLMRTA